MVDKTLYRKLKIKKHEPYYQMWVKSCAPGGLAVPVPIVTFIVLLVLKVPY
jgi:hypothetical protein